MKIMVEVDLLQPLPRGTLVKLEGVNTWVEFRFERCPDFCYNCGIIGHGDKSCIGDKREGQTCREGQYGAWMRAGNIMASPLKVCLMTGTEVNKKSREVTLVSKGPSNKGGMITEMGSGVETGTSSRESGKVHKKSDQQKLVMEEKWDEILRESVEMKGSRGKEDKKECTRKEGDIFKGRNINERSKEVVDLENDWNGKENQLSEEMILDASIDRDDNKNYEKGILIKSESETKEANGWIQENRGNQGRKKQWRRSSRIKRVPLKDITDRGTVSSLGEKRKTTDEWQDLDFMEEDVTHSPQHKILRRDQEVEKQGGELEASPAMPPPSQ